MKILIIANPISGGGKGRESAHKIALLLSNKGYTAELFLTDKAGDARDRASTLKGRYDCLVVVGGDGTVNEVANGLPQGSMPPMAIFPQGTANMLAKELNIPKNHEKFVEVVERNRTKQIDLGKISYKREGESQLNKLFVLTASSGFDAMVTEEVQKRRKGRLGYSGYLAPIASLIASYQAPRLRVRVDGASPVEGAMVVVGNVKNYGGLFSITDQAQCDSGHFDICIMKKGSIPALIKYSVSALFKLMSKRKDIIYLTGREINIDSEEPVAVEVDGDYLCNTPVEITIEPGKMPVIYNDI